MGTYHLAAGGETSWYDYARYVFEVARKGGWPLRVAEQDVHPIGSDEFPSAAPRPLNSRLDCSLLKSKFGFHLPNWRVGVARAVSEIILQEENS